MCVCVCVIIATHPFHSHSLLWKYFHKLLEFGYSHSMIFQGF